MKGIFPFIQRKVEEFNQLRCDECGVRMGYIYELDVEGSFFVCETCMKAAKGEEA